MTTDWIVKSIAPKSDQLNADDLLTGPIDASVTDVKQGDSEQPIVICIDGGRQPYKPCKSMRRLLVKVWGDAPKKWIGQRMRLYCDPDVKWAGVKVGGIRISHVSGIETRQEMMLTVSKGHRSAFIVEPMPNGKPAPSADSIDDRVSKAIKAINEATDLKLIDAYEAKLRAEVLPKCNTDQASRVSVALNDARDRLREE